MGTFQHDFGEHLLSADDSLKSDFHRFLRMDQKERRELFRAARGDGRAYFSPRPGVHLIIKRNPDGTYKLDRRH